MITFSYTAKNSATGVTVRAEVQAENEQAAGRLLIGQGLYPIAIRDKRKSRSLSDISFGSPVRNKDRVVFTRQLATLVGAGLPLAQSLRSAASQTSSKNLKAIMRSVVTSVEGGTSLSAAFAQHPKVFGAIYVSLIAAGESSGTLDVTLERIATQQEKDAAILSKVRGALLYPLIVMVVIIAVVIFMLTTVLPQVALLYRDLKRELPFLTKLLVDLATFVQRFWWLVLLLLGLAVWGLINYSKTSAGRYLLDSFKLRVPVFGRILRKLYMARFARTLGTLLGSGVPMLDSLDISRKAISNVILENGISEAANQVKAGKALSAALEGRPGFTELVPQMTSIGEQSGSIDGMLTRVADYYEAELDEEIKNLSTTIEPALMVLLAITVGGIVAAVLLPVYGLIGSGGLDSVR